MYTDILFWVQKSSIFSIKDSLKLKTFLLEEIDVEILGDTQDNLRAYYYPDDEDPVLFTPYILPNLDLLINEIWY